MVVKRVVVALWLVALGWIIAAGVLARSDVGERWIAMGRNGRVFVQLWQWWGRWALLPALLALVIGIVIARRGRWWRAILAIVLALGAWATVIEPALLVVREERIEVAGAPKLRVALVSDLHIGLFGRDLPGLVSTLNGLDVDAVVVAGDWTYDPAHDLDEVFAPLATLRHPVFGVLGNHDLSAPGANLAKPLRAALTKHGVTLLDGTSQQFKGWELVGMDDLWGGRPGAQVKGLLGAKTAPRFVIMHQPDTVALLPRGAADVLVAGHTHGGQVNIPVVTRWYAQRGITPLGLDYGRFDTPAGVLRVTSGTGMIGMPVRFARPPEVVVLEIG